MRIKYHFGDEPPEIRKRFSAFSRMLRLAYKQLPPELKDAEVVFKVSSTPIRLCDFQNHSIAAQCHRKDNFILFILREGEDFPAQESLNWLVAHEMAHWKLDHAGDNPNEEEAAVLLQNKYGFVWRQHYQYASAIHLTGC